MLTVGVFVAAVILSDIYQQATVMNCDSAPKISECLHERNHNNYLD